jgi:uncharacterized membrane protein
MAGIGFELKKLFGARGVLPGIKACFVSSFIVMGPTLICMAMLTALQQFLVYLEIPLEKRELFTAAIVYSFIFSLLATCGFTMVLSRYVSDRIYENRYEDILPSMHGALTVCITAGGTAAALFYYKSPLNPCFKTAAYILFVELVILWIQSVYMSILKDYARVLRGFVLGVCTGIMLSYSAVMLLKADVINGLLVSADMGFFVIIIFLGRSIQRSFKKSRRNYFDFLRYLGRYPSLFFTGVFQMLGTYIHNFVFWFGDYRVTAGGTYVFSPFYDVPAFWAFLSTIPAMVIFVVSLETSFYEKSKEYYFMISHDGTIDDIEQTKDEMLEALSEGLMHVMKLQLFFTAGFLVLGIKLLPLIGFSSSLVGIFSMLVIGYYAFIMTFITILILLHFDDRKGALLISGAFLSLNALLTLLSTFSEEHYLGAGFFGASFISLVLALIRLLSFVKNIDYHVYCSQPIVNKNYEGFFSWLALRMEKWLG